MAIIKNKNVGTLAITLLGLLLFSILFASISYTKPAICHFAETNEQIPSPNEDTTRIRIGFVGDIMAHLTQLNAQKQDDSTYDFNNNYVWLTSMFQANDLMIGNLETTFSGKEKGYSAYPMFNTPDALADALKNAGFDILSTANNHMYDRSTHGLLRTMQVLKEQQLLFTGSRSSTEEKRYLIYPVKGVNIGVIAYTYESGRYGDTVTINGLRIKKEDAARINSFNPQNLGETTAEMRKEYQNMLKEGADVVVFIIHWGDEYRIMPSAYQLSLADSLNKIGVDIVFGSHPHVVQPVDYLFDSVRQHTTLVVYSAGNFISNQRYETLENYNTEDGLYVEVTLQKTTANPIFIANASFYPTWVHKYQHEGKNVYEVVPTEYVLAQDSLKNKFTDAQLERMEKSRERTVERITLLQKK